MSRPTRLEDSARSPEAPLFVGAPEGALFAVAVLAVAGVALYFDLSVNRVFDVPKATALKTLGGLAALAWLVRALTVGVRWGSARVFAAPVAGLALAMGVSTLSSIDPATSLYGVYERQFGLQGVLACAGLYFVASTSVASRSGALLGLSIVALLGGMLGAYAFLQSAGHDPWPFFREPQNKVYSFLGNATFSGNALALIFPLSAALALVEATQPPDDERSARWLEGLLAGFAGTLFLLVVPGYLAAAGLGPRDEGRNAQRILQLGYVAAGLLLLGARGLGSTGPSWLRLPHPSQRRFADAVTAGALLACAGLIFAGIYFTRTRGAWVGTAVALVAGFLLAPLLFQGAARRRAALAMGGGLVALALGFAVWVSASDGLAARTFRSIPAAFDSSQTTGKGQGTRPYLWKESVRVLTAHGDTLARMAEDAADRAKGVDGPLLEDLPFRRTEAPGEAELARDHAWRRAAVWLFGIGIETYRYAFMSHKSKRLEALDPMTNHDNPHNNYLYVLASFGVVGLAAYLWLLVSLLRQAFLRFIDVDAPLAHRGLAFGVVLSFFSYAVYSIAGFDSVACSVLLYFVLGLCAVLFQPNHGTPAAPLAEWLLPRPKLAKARPALVAALVGVALLLVHTAWSGWRIHRAERAFTGRDSPDRATLEGRVADIEQAIRLNPHESYYKQSLGSTFAQGAAQYIQQARRLEQAALQARREGRAAEADRLRKQAEDFAATGDRYTEKARIALLAALDHAWAPENIYISLFQALYAVNRDREAEAAIERALRHSPHLGAVRANLAALQLQRGALEEALANCRWVIEVDPRSALAFRTCGKALLQLGRVDEAGPMLDQARRLEPNDRTTQALLADWERARQAPPVEASTRSQGATPGGADVVEP